MALPRQPTRARVRPESPGVAGDGAEAALLSPRAGVLQVVAGVLRDDSGRVLLAQRPAGRTHAGLWEFPGGKIEPGESADLALRRELAEELGVRIGTLRPLLRVPWRYPERDIVLDVLEVDAFDGEPHGREGQQLAWVAPQDLWKWPMPAADRPVAVALRLPRQYAITPDPEGRIEALFDAARRRLEGGARLLQLRARSLPDAGLLDVARRLLPYASAVGATLLANADPARVADVPGLGVHLTAARLAALDARPLPLSRQVAASCHDAVELERALARGCDFAVFGPVLRTPSHPGAEGVGWGTLAAACEGCPLPVFALGGLGPTDLPTARAAGAFGVAGIRGFGG